MRWGILIFFSGAAALVYQTLWVKQLGLVVGGDVYAVTIGVAAFFAGLAFGNHVLGRRVDVSSHPVMMFAGLEVGIAATAILSTIVLSGVAPAFVAMQGSVGALAWALPFLLVGLPAFFMGGTLPAMMRARAPDEESIGRVAGRLYAANTAGAVIGVLAAAFFLLPSFGVRATGLFAGAVNLAVGLAAVMIARHRGAEPMRRTQTVPPLSRDARLAVLLYSIAGGIALGYEVVWSEAIVQFLSTRAYAFAVMLATYLVGLVLGAWIHARYADRVERPWTVFGILVAGAGGTALLLFVVLGGWLLAFQSTVGTWMFDVTGSQQAKMCARFAVVAAVLVLPPAVMLGAAFPAAVRLMARAKRVGGDIGLIAGWNIAGGIAGTLLTGFVLIPAVGLIRALGVLAIGASIVGAVALLRGGKRSPRLVGWAVGFVAVAVALTLLTPHDKLGRLLADERGGTLLFYEESAEGTVAVVQQQSSTHVFRRLYISGVSNSGDAMPSRRYMRLQALVPVLVHSGEPRSALVIGYGTGITAGALLAYPLERCTCAELVPAVVEAGPLFSGSGGALTDPRMDIQIRDGRHHLLETEDTYDVITLEPPPPSARGVVNLYSTEFYALARDRLAHKGLLAQWWPLATQNDEDSQSLIKSIVEVFPHVTLWTTEIHEMMVIGSMQPIVLDGDRIADRFALPRVTRALSEVGVSSTADLLATYVMGENGLVSYALGALPVTDDKPRIEYSPWVRPNEITRVLPRLMELAEALPIIGAGQLLRDRAHGEREELFDFYRATMAAYEGDVEASRRALDRVLERDGDNPYYLWFAAGAR